MTQAIAYLVLGAAGSGRHDMAADLIGGFPDSGRVTVFAAATEEAAVSSSKLGDAGTFMSETWNWENGEIQADIPEGTTHLLFVSDGRRDPVDQVEAFYHWSNEKGLEAGRIITVVNCRFARENPALDKWYDACIHFSDYVLLNRREGVPEKWMKDFQDRYRKSYYPCIFELVKKGKVKNPALVMDPVSRRLSQLFDRDEEDIEGPEDEEREEGFLDPYLERLPSGRRAREIPDIRDYIPL